jgi:hypothetical protein
VCTGSSRRKEKEKKKNKTKDLFLSLSFFPSDISRELSSKCCASDTSASWQQKSGEVGKSFPAIATVQGQSAVMDGSKCSG